MNCVWPTRRRRPTMAERGQATSGRVRRRSSSLIQDHFKTEFAERGPIILISKRVLRVNRIDEVHCRRRKRRNEKEIGHASRKAGSIARPEKSFIPRGFSADALVAEKPPDSKNWRSDGNWGLTISRLYSISYERPVSRKLLTGESDSARRVQRYISQSSCRPLGSAIHGRSAAFSSKTRGGSRVSK